MELLFLNLGGGEIFIVLLVVLLLFGGKGVPTIARTLGKGIREFKDAANGIQRDLNDGLSEMKKDMQTDKREVKEEPKDLEQKKEV